MRAASALISRSVDIATLAVYRLLEGKLRSVGDVSEKTCGPFRAI